MLKDMAAVAALLLCGTAAQAVTYTYSITTTAIPKNQFPREEVQFTTSNPSFMLGLADLTSFSYTHYFFPPQTLTAGLSDLTGFGAKVDGSKILFLSFAGSSSGQFSYGYDSSLPEPGTWATMLLGFGAIVYSMRRRQLGLAKA